MSGRNKFQDGETVLCYQGYLIYEAKVQGIKYDGNLILYDVHYKGWNKTWDEWVAEDRIMKMNEENIKKKKEVASEMKAKKSFAAKKTGAVETIKITNLDFGDEQSSSREVSKDRDVVKPKIPRVKKLRSRSNSDASIVSIHSNKSVDSKKPAEVPPKKKKINKRSKSQSKKAPVKVSLVSDTVAVEEDITIVEEPPNRPKTRPVKPIVYEEIAIVEEPPTRPKTRPVKPLAVLKTATEIPKSHKKNKKKKKAKEISPVKIGKTPIKKSKKASKPKIKKSISVPPNEESSLRSKRKFGEEIVIPLSDELKTVLVDDFDYIGRQRKLLQVPSRYTVDDLINAYYESRKSVDGASEEQLLGAEEVCRGLKDYFNSTLGSQLLYKFERVQYADTLKENTGVPMAQLYGPVHLLRLLTKLGPMLSAADIEKDAMDKLVGHVEDFIGYMHKHKETLYQIEDYGTATPEYHRRAL